MSAHVSDLEVHSSLGRVTLTMDRDYTVRSVPESTDLPDDMRRALLYWLGVKQLPETMDEETLQKVRDVLVGQVQESVAIDLINALQNEGILFRERA